MCRNSVVNVVEIKKESIDSYDSVTTCLRPYGDQALRIKIPNFFCFATRRAPAIICKAGFPRGEFVRANEKFSNVIGWRKIEFFH